jgi:DNA-directed RNA polymerase subunit M/transcription elongation factor TFIIS
LYCLLQVVGLDALSLAPAAVQQAVQRRREEQRRNEAVWEQLMSDSVGGGGTHVVDAKCPQCSHPKAQVHTILSGGTYAQERQTIQKYVCQGCNFTWRNDS